MYKTAQTLTAWEGRREVTVEDIRRSAEFVLLHRRRRQPFEETGVDNQQIDDIIQEHFENNSPQSHPREGQNSPSDDTTEGE